MSDDGIRSAKRLSDPKPSGYRVNKYELETDLGDLYREIIEKLSREDHAFEFRIGKNRYQLFHPTTPGEAKKITKLRKKIAKHILKKDLYEFVRHADCILEGNDCDHRHFGRLDFLEDVMNVRYSTNEVVYDKKEDIPEESQCKKCHRYWLHRAKETNDLCRKCKEH